MITWLGDEGFGLDGSSPIATVHVYNNATTGISRAEIIRDRDQLTMTMRDGTSQDRKISDILEESDSAWTVLEVR